MDEKNICVVTIHHLIRRNQEKYLANKLGDEVVMMNTENGSFISMNNVGADIWALSENSLPVSELVKRLTDMYDISENDCREQTISFLQQSQAQDIFIIQSPQH